MNEQVRYAIELLVAAGLSLGLSPISELITVIVVGFSYFINIRICTYSKEMYMWFHL